MSASKDKDLDSSELRWTLQSLDTSSQITLLHNVLEAMFGENYISLLSAELTSRKRKIRDDAKAEESQVTTTTNSNEVSSTSSATTSTAGIGDESSSVNNDNDPLPTDHLPPKKRLLRRFK